MECPFEVRHLWDFYLEVAPTRGGSGFGLNPLTIRDVMDWEEGTEREPPLSPWERIQIVKIDREFLRIANDRKTTKKKPRTSSKGPGGVRALMASFGAKKAPAKAKANGSNGQPKPSG